MRCGQSRRVPREYPWRRLARTESPQPAGSRPRPNRVGPPAWMQPARLRQRPRRRGSSAASTETWRPVGLKSRHQGSRGWLWRRTRSRSSPRSSGDIGAIEKELNWHLDVTFREGPLPSSEGQDRCQLQHPPQDRDDCAQERENSQARGEEQPHLSRLRRRLPAQSPCRPLTYGAIAVGTYPSQHAPTDSAGEDFFRPAPPVGIPPNC